MAKARKLDLLKELHGEDNFEEIEGSNHIRVNGERAYVLDPSKSLSVRHELIADLASTGMKPAEIATLVKTNGHKSDGGYYATLLRDPRIRERAKSADLKDILVAAKKKIEDSVVKAAENIADAVQQGDVKVSQYVLATHGITDKVQQTTNVNMDFGSWLSGEMNTKTMHDITPGNKEITTDIDALPAPTGATLVDEDD